MKAIIDVQVDEADDLIIQSDDLLIEENILQAVLNVAGRRVVGRYDDTTLRDNVCAGLERFLFSTNIKNSLYDIKNTIIKCLTRDNLFSANEFDIISTNAEGERDAKLYIIFKTALFNNASTFRIYVDVQNQRIFRG